MAQGGVDAGVAALEAHLPGGGLVLGRLHFVEGARREWDDGAVAGFALALLARLHAASMSGRPLLWVARVFRGWCHWLRDEVVYNVMGEEEGRRLWLAMAHRLLPHGRHAGVAQARRGRRAG